MLEDLLLEDLLLEGQAAMPQEAFLPEGLGQAVDWAGLAHSVEKEWQLEKE